MFYFWILMKVYFWYKNYVRVISVGRKRSEKYLIFGVETSTHFSGEKNGKTSYFSVETTHFC